jgi:precorrin-4/cobalt-precorrin-4 C11-methyltransferase
MSQPKANQPVVYFAGSGPGDPDLITVKAKNLLAMADTIVYSGSLLNPKLLECTKKNARLYDASLIDREKIYEIMRDASWAGQLVMRLHDGDPNIYGATKEQVDKLQADGITCKMIPGVTSLLGAAASLNMELTLPGNTQTIIITRAELRTPVPEREKISKLATHGSTMGFYLSVHLIKEIVRQLLEGGVYTFDTPAAVVYRATWEDEVIITGNLADIAIKTQKARITKTALFIVGNVVKPTGYQFSKVYDPDFSHGYRNASIQPKVDS